MLKACRECRNEVSTEATFCPKCGCPYPSTDPKELAQKQFGFEYKSRTHLLGLPLIHISFKYGRNFMPVPAKGIISIGQFGIGIINISQFGIGLLSVSQFTLAGFAIAQFAIAYSLVAQFGIYLHQGKGLLVISLTELMGKLF